MIIKLKTKVDIIMILVNTGHGDTLDMGTGTLSHSGIIHMHVDEIEDMGPDLSLR